MDDTSSATFEVKDCKACLGGEFAENIDLSVAYASGGLDHPERHFTLRTPFDSEPLDVLGLGQQDGRWELGFHSLSMVDLEEIPESVSLLFDGKEIPTSPCRLWDSRALTPDGFISPTEVLGSAPSLRLQSIRTNQWFGRINFMPATSGSWTAARSRLSRS